MNHTIHQPLRVFLADGSPDVRTALRLVIEHQSGMQVIGEATDAIHLLAQAADTCLDLVLLDADLPGLALPRRTPLSSLRGMLYTLRKICPGASIIVLSSEPMTVDPDLQARADAFVCKSDPPDALLAFFEEILNETNR